MIVHAHLNGARTPDYHPCLPASIEALVGLVSRQAPRSSICMFAVQKAWRRTPAKGAFNAAL